MARKTTGVVLSIILISIAALPAGAVGAAVQSGPQPGISRQSSWL